MCTGKKIPRYLHCELNRAIMYLEEAISMQTTLKVEGMTCSHCENAIKKAVSAIDGVSGVRVDLAGKTITVTHDETVVLDALKNEIEEEGYSIV